MQKREKLLNYLRDPEERSVVARILDKVELAGRVYEPQVLDFYDPYLQNLIGEVLPGDPDVTYSWNGGYEGAERRRLIIYPSFIQLEDIDAQLNYLKLKANLKFQKVTHRDYLGAILGLGIKREKVGDLLPVDDGCQVIVEADIASYIELNLQKIHRLHVSVQRISAEELILPQENFREIRATVASLRLDAVSATAFGLSRGEINKEIAGEKVKLNWALCTDGARQIQQGDLISLRGKGRFRIDTISGETRKGRISVIIKKFG